MATMAIAGREMERMQTRHTRQRRTLTVAERNRELFEKQRARRRGPTPEMPFAKHIDNSRIVKADDPQRRREMTSFTIAMVLCCVLTMFYVWQHVGAIEMGYNVEVQKQQVEHLREQNRQLRLAEARLSDPGRIDVLARQDGMSEPLPGQVIQQDAPSVAAPVLAQAHMPAMQGN
jgi:cell division protein FtsL